MQGPWLLLMCDLSLFESIIYIVQENCGYSHKGSFACLYVVALGALPGFTADAHEDATLVEEATGGIHDQQEQHTHQYKNTNNYSCVQARPVFHGVLRRNRIDADNETEQEDYQPTNYIQCNSQASMSYFQIIRLAKAKTIDEGNRAKITTPPLDVIVHSVNKIPNFRLKGIVHQ